MYIERKLEGVISTYIKDREILAIIGPRQSGKTTLLKKIKDQLPNSIYINFEDREELALFEERLKEFAYKYMSYDYLFIDEFQHAKLGGKNLKYLYDTYPNKIIISGSSAMDLTVKAIKFLVGRILVFNLYQLNFEEFLSFRDSGLLKVYRECRNGLDLKNLIIPKIEASDTANIQLTRLLEEFIRWGGYPRVVLANSEEEKKVKLKNIYTTYFLRDIKDMLGLIDDYKLARLIEALAVQIGQIINYQELSQISGYAHVTLKKYLNILEKTFICEAVRPFYTNKRKEIVKNPKVYFFDTGLRNYIVDNFSPLAQRTDKGQLYENHIFTELLKHDIVVNYWRNQTQAEVDFLMKFGIHYIPIESKSHLKKNDISKSLASFIKKYHPKAAIVLNDIYYPPRTEDTTKIYFLPRWII